MAWTKITPHKGTWDGDPTPRTVKSSAGTTLLFPKGYGFNPGDRVNVFTDGNGRLAWERSLDGAYRVSKGNNHCVSVRVPAHHSDEIRSGRSDARVYAEGGMVILDLSSVIDAHRIAAE